MPQIGRRCGLPSQVRAVGRRARPQRAARRLRGEGERLVDGRANNRVTEPPRRLRTQNVDACERARCVGGGLQVQAGERGRLAWIGVVAQDRDRLCKPPRFRWKAGKANRDRTRAGPRPELAQARSEEHTSELQSRRELVCRLLLEKKKKTKYTPYAIKIKKTKKNN